MPRPTSEVMLDVLANEKDIYIPNDAAAEVLGEKVLGMVIGPAFTGKSTIIQCAVALDKDQGEIVAASAFTTRERRPSDTDGEYTFYTHDEAGISVLFTMQQRGELAQYVAFPGMGKIYGSVPGDYPGVYNLRPVMASGVEGMLRAPFMRHHIIGLACSPDEWDARDRTSLQDRGEEAAAQRPARIREGVESLDWCLSHPELQWVSNPDGGLDVAAQTVIQVIREQEAAPPQNRRDAEALYKHLSALAVEL